MTIHFISSHERRTWLRLLELDHEARAERARRRELRQALRRKNADARPRA